MYNVCRKHYFIIFKILRNRFVFNYHNYKHSVAYSKRLVRSFCELQYILSPRMSVGYKMLYISTILNQNIINIYQIENIIY